MLRTSQSAGNGPVPKAAGAAGVFGQRRMGFLGSGAGVGLDVPVSPVQIRMFCDALISHFGGAGRDEDAEQTLHPQPRDERRRQGINSAVPWGHQHPSPQTSILQRMPRALSLSPKNTCPEGLLYGK